MGLATNANTLGIVKARLIFQHVSYAVSLARFSSVKRTDTTLDSLQERACLAIQTLRNRGGDCCWKMPHYGPATASMNADFDSRLSISRPQLSNDFPFVTGQREGFVEELLMRVQRSQVEQLPGKPVGYHDLSEFEVAERHDGHTPALTLGVVSKPATVLLLSRDQVPRASSNRFGRHGWTPGMPDSDRSRLPLLPRNRHLS